MEEMPSHNVPVQRLKVAILPLDLPCSGPVTYSGEIFLTTGKSHGKKPDRYKTNAQFAKELKNNNNFGQITGIQEKLDKTCI